MTHLRSLVTTAVALAACVVIGGSVQAQLADPRPLSRPGGFTNQMLNDIYRQDVGTGFSSSSLNQLALQNARAQVPFAGQQTAPRPAPTSIGLGPVSGGGKPFSGFSPEPTVSPYMNLFREDFGGNSDLNYNTLVRPQLQQQQVNQQVQRQNMEVSRRLQAIAAQGAFNPQGARDQFPTGHQTVFMYYGHYYPAAARRPRR